jgi:ATP-dependent RNA helicase SUPV3L1/SUV3
MRIERRIVAFVRDYVAAMLGPLGEDPELSAAGRGLVYQLRQGLGTVPLAQCAPVADALDGRDRSWFGGAGVRRGQRYVYLEPLMTAESIAQRRRLLLLTTAAVPDPRGNRVDGRRRSVTDDVYLRLGYVPIDRIVVRVDVFEAAQDRLRGTTDTRALARDLAIGIRAAKVLARAASAPL